jgi:glutamyl-tRNA synthetase
MRNFLALLGWNPGDERELFFEMDELVRAFSIDRIQKTSAVFDMTKLEWMNGQYLGHEPLPSLTAMLAQHLASLGVDVAAYPVERVHACVASIRGRSRTTIELAQRVATRLDRRHIARDDAKAQQTVAKDPAGFRVALQSAHAHLAALPPDAWEPGRLEAELRALAQARGVGAGAVMQPIRIAITGTRCQPVGVGGGGSRRKSGRLVAAQDAGPRPHSPAFRRPAGLSWAVPVARASPSPRGGRVSVAQRLQDA